MQKDIQSLFNFDKLDIYRGFDWKKEFKAPTDHCFGLKYPQIQKVSPKYMKYVCCENESDYKKWMCGIRLVKFGRQLYENFKKITELEELSKISGFNLLSNNRRSSAALSIQRPRSNYSITSLERSNSVNSGIQTKPQLSIFNNKVNEDSSYNQNEFYDEQNSFRSNLHATTTTTAMPKFLQQNQTYIPIKTNNEASSLLNMLKPRRSQSSVSSMTNQVAHKSAKLPVTTGVTKQMLASSDQKVEDGEDEIINYIPEQQQQQRYNMLVNSNQKLLSPTIKTLTSSISVTTQDSNVFDFPSPPAELLEASFTEQNCLMNNSPLPSPPIVTVSSPTTDTNVLLRLYKSPLINEPKSALQSSNLNRSLSQSINYRPDSLSPTENNQRRMSNSSNYCSISSKPTTNSNNPQLLDELSTKLARQRKIIEVDENNRLSSNNNDLDNAYKTSPKIQKKPPPPPRSDSIRISNSNLLRKNSIN